MQVAYRIIFFKLNFRQQKMVDLKATEAQKSMKIETPLRMQVFLGIITNLVIISPGMNLGFSAVALPALKSPTNPLRLSIDEATWVGKFEYSLSPPKEPLKIAT